MVGRMILPLRPFCAAALGCSVVLFGNDSLLEPAAASGLQHQHTLYGKCTHDDVNAARTGSPSFLSSHRLEKIASPVACQRALANSDSALAMGLNETPVNARSFKTKAVTRQSSDQEIVARAVELLQDEGFNGGERGHEALRVLDQYMKAVLKDSTVFALGLGPELIPLSKIANNVIAIEGSQRKCAEFLKAEEGACAMQDNVHVYCVRPDETSGSGQKQEGSGSAGAQNGGAASLLQISETFGATPGSSEGHAALAAYGSLVKDLIHQQFGGVPLSAVVVLGTSAVAKLLLLLPYVDQSTVIVSRSRMTPSGLAVLGEFVTFRVGNVEGRNHEEPYSAESIFTMQRRYSPPVDPDLWMKYSTAEWELADRMEPFNLLNETFKMVLDAVDSDGLNGERKELLRVFKRIYLHALKDGTDAEWGNIEASLETIKSMKGKNKDAIIGAIKAFAEEFAIAKIKSARLQSYLELMQGVANKQEPFKKELVEARIIDLLSAAADIVTSPGMLDTFKDAVEDACELAEAKPDTFLPAIRLIYGTLVSLDGLEEVVMLLASGRRIDIFGSAK